MCGWIEWIYMKIIVITDNNMFIEKYNDCSEITYDNNHIKKCL